MDESIHYWQKLLNVDKYWEYAYYGIIRCYLRQGRRTLAMRQYQQYEEILREVPASTGAAIQRLHQKLVQYEE
jgi:DNA-binding SARP family transcriptional activator